MSGPWFTASELAALALPDMPDDSTNVRRMADRLDWQRPDWEGTRWRKRRGQGGGVEYHASVLPRAAQVKLAWDEAREAVAAPVVAGPERAEMWRWFDALPEGKKREALRRLGILDAVGTLVRAGVGKVFAVAEIARTSSVAASGIYRWEKMLHGVERPDRLPYLAPRHAGRPGGAECHPDAWEMFRADYLRLEQPSLSDVYDRLRRTAAVRGWTVPSRTTLARRIEAMAPEIVVCGRQGQEALKRLYPAQQRLRDVFHALEAVNLDGHTWDLFVRWPDGTVGRPVMLAVQDLYSGMILAHRVDRTLHQGLVRLAIGDVVEAFGIPSHCWMDNGRENCSKAITGQVGNRYRFKVREEDPAGLLPMLGIQAHFTSPYSGQSKPIERAFRDFAGGVAKHPAFAGAWTGNTPMAKPENYGSKAVPLDEFVRVVGEEIARLNARPGRESRVCGGRLSFQQAYSASVEEGAPVRRATAEQRRLWLLMAEALRVSKRDGTVELLGNRFWADFLLPHRGGTVVGRFDPDALQEPLHLYRPDGGYLGAAQCTEAAGFADVDAAREHGRARRAWMRASKAMLEAEVTIGIAEVAAMLPAAPATPDAPEPRVVRPFFGTAGSAARQAMPETADWPAGDDEMPEGERLLLRAAAMQRAGRAGLRVVEAGGDD